MLAFLLVLASSRSVGMDKNIMPKKSFNKKLESDLVFELEFELDLELPSIDLEEIQTPSMPFTHQKMKFSDANEKLQLIKKIIDRQNIYQQKKRDRIVNKFQTTNQFIKAIPLWLKNIAGNIDNGMSRLTVDY